MKMRKRGITLIELMIAMALSAIVAGTVVFIVASAKRLMSGGVAYLDATQQNQQIINRVKQEIELANLIYSAEAPYIAFYRNSFSLAPLASSFYTPTNKVTSDNPEHLPWQVSDPVNGPFWKGIQDDIVVYFFSRTAQGRGGVYREVRDGYNPATRLQGPSMISDPNIEVDHLKFTYFNYTMQFPEYLPFRYTGATVWNQGGAVYTQYAKIPPYTRDVKVVISPGNYPQNKWNTLSGTREGPPLEVGTTLQMQSRTASPAGVWWEDALPAGASWNSYADFFEICTVGSCDNVDAVVNGPDGRLNQLDAARPGLKWRFMPYDDPWAYSGLTFNSPCVADPSLPQCMSYSQTEEYVPDYPNPYQKIHMHYFYNAAALPTAGPFADDDNQHIFVHAYINPSPIDYVKQIMLMFHCNDGAHCTGGRNDLSYWRHRAYWTNKEFLRFDNQNDKDENGNGSSIDDGLIPWGVNGVSRAYMGEMPPGGQWVVLSVPVTKSGIDLKNRQITGMAFALYGGQVYWDKASYGTWSAWTDSPGATVADIFTDAAITAPANNYYQWRAYMERPENDDSVTPVLKDVTLNYGSDLLFTSAAYPDPTVYSTSQEWLSTQENEFNRSKDKKATAVNADGTITLARPKCFEFKANNRLAYDLLNYPVVVSANTFNEVLEGDIRADGNDMRVYDKRHIDNKCISYPNLTPNSPVAAGDNPAPCAGMGTVAAFKASGRRFGTGQTNVAFLDNVLQDDVGTPAVNEGEKSYYMCFGDLLQETGHWVLPANHTATVGGTAINEPYLPPIQFPATVDSCATALWTCIWDFVVAMVGAIGSFPPAIGDIINAWNNLMTCGSCWFAGGVPKFHPTNPVENSYNFSGVPFSGYSNTYYDPTGATTQYVFTSYGGLTHYDDYDYNDAGSGYRDDIAGLYHFYDEPEDSLGAIRNISGHILPHGVYDVTTGKYYYITTAGHLGGCSGRPGAQLQVQCPSGGGTTSVAFNASGGPVACGDSGNVTATLRNAGRPDNTPNWWEVVVDKPVLGIKLFEVNAESSIAGDACFNIPEDDTNTFENEDFYRGIITHPGRYIAKDSWQGRETTSGAAGSTTLVDSVSVAMPANGGNLWAYTLGAQDNPTKYDQYRYYADAIPELIVPSSYKAGKWDSIGSGCGSPNTTVVGGVGLPWGTGNTDTRLCCFGCSGEGAGWVWMDLGSAKPFDRIEIQWGQSSPQAEQEVWAMDKGSDPGDDVGAAGCYAAMRDTNSSDDGAFPVDRATCDGIAGPTGATRLASNGFIMGGGSNNCGFSYGGGTECGFNERFGSAAWTTLFLPIGYGSNSTYDYVTFSAPQTYRYIAVKGRVNGLVPILGLGQPGWITAVDFNQIRIWNKTNVLDYNGATLPDPTTYELKDIGGVSDYDWWQAIFNTGFIRFFLRNHGYAYFMNKPVAASTTHYAAIRQLRKIEVGCYDYTMLPLLGFFGYSCSATLDEGITLAAGGAFYQPPLVTPAKPLGWLDPVTYGFTKYASDTAAGSSPARAIDNDMGSYWESLNNITAATQPKLYMDLGMDRKINMIVVYPEFASGNGYRYSVNVAKSADCPGGCDNCPATAWVQVGMKADMQPSSEGGDTFSFAPGQYRCVMEEFLDGSKGTTSSGAPTWWAGGAAGDVPAKILEQEAYLAKYEKQGFYHSMPFVGDSHRTWTIPYTRDAYDIRLHFVKFDPSSSEDYVTVWDTVTSNVLWSQAPGIGAINSTKCTAGAGNTALPGDPGTQFWTPWLRSCLTSAGAYDPALCKCYDESLTNTGASTKIPGQQIKLFWLGPIGWNAAVKQGWVIDKYQIWGIINPALIQVDVQSCSGTGKSRRCVSTVDKVQPANLLYQTRLRNVMK